jgi:hypothetical protein
MSETESPSMRVPVTTRDDGVISVHHTLGMDVEVVCETADGVRVGYLAANRISDGEIEVIPVPGGPEVAVVILRHAPAGNTVE